MSLARAAIHRPVFTTMVTLMVVILGLVALQRVPLDLMPDVTYPALSISTGYENASPAEIEELITRPIEEAVSAVPGVVEVSSTSAEGNSDVSVTFAWGMDLDAAANDVRDRLDRVMPRLPEEADRPVLRKFDLASFPILILGAASRLDPLQMRSIIDHQVKYRIERVPGVAALDIRGGQEREIHVWLNADKVKALGIPLGVLAARIKSANVTLPAGILEYGNYELVVRTPGEFTSLEQLRDTVVALREGVPVRLGDIAEIEDGWEKITQLVRFNGEPGIRLAVNKQSGKNTVAVAREVLREVARLNAEIPQLRIVPLINTADYIERSIANVGRSAVLGGIYAILVLLFFLRNIRSTAIIATAIPISIIATFMLIYFGGFTLNLMTLGGLALGVGMLVDNSIVVLENIYRLRETDPDQDAVAAAVQGTEEVAAAIVASTLTTLVVFLPLIFVRGMAGIMFKQLAFVVGFALLCSMGVALTLVPMLASRYLHPPDLKAAPGETIAHKLFRVTGLILARIEDQYKRMLQAVLRHRAWVVLAVALIFMASLAVIPLVGTELMPAADEGDVRVSVELEPGIRLDVLERTMAQIEAIVARAVPEARDTVMRTGGFGQRSGAGHVAELRVILKPLRERKRSSDDIAAALRGQLAGIPGATIRTRAGQGLFILRMAAGSGESIAVEIRGYDLDIADALARQVKDIVAGVPGVTDAKISREAGQPERWVVVDRARAETLKVTVADVANMLQTVLGGTRASYYRDGGDEYPIRIQLKDAEQQDMRDVLDLTLPNADGEPVVLRNLVEVASRSGPTQIDRKDQERVVTVTGNIRGRDMGSVLADIRRELAGVPVPRDFAIGFGGDYAEQQKAFRELGVGLALALLLVYMVMACQYESLKDPLVVMFSVPMALIGVVLMLLLSHTTFNIQSYIGCIMLGGIVVNNAILLVDQTNRLRRHDGLATRAAIAEAGRRRLRPILMTALTTTLGLLPLAIGMGEGGEAQAPLARAVIGGLFSSTLFTLLLIPVVYSLFEEGWRPHARPVA